MIHYDCKMGFGYDSLSDVCILINLAFVLKSFCGDMHLIFLVKSLFSPHIYHTHACKYNQLHHKI